MVAAAQKAVASPPPSDARSAGKPRGTVRASVCRATIDQEWHAPGCRPARPLCRYMRKRRENRRPCRCVAYHYPHRNGSGACQVGIPAVLLAGYRAPIDEAGPAGAHETYIAVAFDEESFRESV